MMGKGIEIGIGPHPLVHAAAQQGMDGPVARLAQNVPTRNLKAGKGPHDGQIGPLGKAGRIGTAEHQFDVFRVFTQHVTSKHVFDDRAHGLWSDRGCIAFAPTHDAVVSGHLDQYPIAPTPTGRRRSGHDDLKALQFHDLSLASSCRINSGGGAPAPGAAPPFNG